MKCENILGTTRVYTKMKCNIPINVYYITGFIQCTLRVPTNRSYNGSCTLRRAAGPRRLCTVPDAGKSEGMEKWSRLYGTSFWVRTHYTSCWSVTWSGKTGPYRWQIKLLNDHHCEVYTLHSAVWDCILSTVGQGLTCVIKQQYYLWSSVLIPCVCVLRRCYSYQHCIAFTVAICFSTTY